MLEVSKKKLLIANIIYYSSIVLTIAYVVVSILRNWPRGIVFLFLIPMLYGGNARTSLFKCPNCGRRLFSGASRKDIRKLNVPDSCPDCETHIEVKYVD